MRILAAMETAHAIVHSSSSSETLYNTDFCMWKDLSYSECERLLDTANSHEDVTTLLQEIMKIDVAMETSTQVQITTDLYTYGVIFARKNNYSPIQLSTLISVLKRVHNACICTPFDNLDATMKMFQELMVKHSVQRPPYSTCVFNIAQVKTITDYVLTTYIKHFKLYKFAFTKKVRLNLMFGPQLFESSGEGVQEETEGGESSSKVADEAREEETTRQQPEVSTDENDLTEKQEQTSDEPDVQIQTTDHSKLESLINSSINEKLEQLQATLETHMQKQEEELLARITSLEQTATAEANKGNKNKKNK